MKHALKVGVDAIAMLLLFAAAGRAQTLQVLSEFTVDNGGPAGVIQGSDGSFYGAASHTNGNGLGSIYRLTPNGAGFTRTTLHSFNGSDGRGVTSLIEATDGFFYGTAIVGGAFNGGSVFRMDTAGVLTVLHFFDTPDGAWYPTSLIQAADGMFYGTTAQGGPIDGGTIFRMTAGGAITVLHGFAGSPADGANPNSLMQGADGLFYGTTGSGGVSGNGTVFRMDGAGVVTVLHSFDPDTTGREPFGALLQASDGFFYGTSSAGAAGSGGTAFRMDETGAVTVLHAFHLFDEGRYSTGALIQGTDGFFYGLLAQGGMGDGGAIFRIDSAGAFTVLHSFSGPDGRNPFGSIIQATDGLLYGTTSFAGSCHGGVVFRFGTGAPPVTTEPCRPDGSLVSLGNARLWIGLKNSDDQGTRFDLLTEVYKNDEFVASGLTRCVIGVTRNPNQALEAIVSFEPFTTVTYGSGDTLSFRTSTRIGTKPDNTKCGGHNNAVGLRMYYDSLQRASRFVAELTPHPTQDFYLHTSGTMDRLDNIAPTSSTAQFKDSPPISVAGGNPWRPIGSWSMTVP